MSRNVAAIVRLTALGLLVVACRADNSRLAQAADAPAAKAGLARETWDICLLQGKRVGYIHTTVSNVGSDGATVRTECENRLSINRGGQVTSMEVRVMSLETPQGQLLSFESETRMGPSPIRITGKVQGNRLDVETLGPGATAPERKSLEWSPDFRGPFAGEQSLLREPMQPGQHRTLKMLMPVFAGVEVVDDEMTAKQYEPTALASGPHNLLRIETVTRVGGGQKIEGTLWSDRTGNVLKNVVGIVETYRATKAEALEKADAAGLDMLPSMTVKVAQPLPRPRETKQVCYRVHLEGGDPASVFVTGPTQAVKSLNPHTAEVTVYAIRPGQSDGNPDAPADPPTDGDRQPNDFIQSNDPLIVADAQKAAGDEKDPWRVAVALERFVNREVTKKDFSQAFASAAEVAKTREGDCTEHSVFLAALARARGIPARTAIGLVYVDGTQSFFYHMWTEVCVEKRWIPIDGTLALGGIAADHLKIAQTNLNGAAAYSAFLPVAQVAGRLKIEIVDVK